MLPVLGARGPWATVQNLAEGLVRLSSSSWQTEQRPQNPIIAMACGNVQHHTSRLRWMAPHQQVGGWHHTSRLRWMAAHQQVAVNELRVLMQCTPLGHGITANPLQLSAVVAQLKHDYPNRGPSHPNPMKSGSVLLLGARLESNSLLAVRCWRGQLICHSCC